MLALCRPKYHGSTPRGTPLDLGLNFPQSDPPPVDLSVRDIRSQIAAEWLQIAQRSQWRTYRKLPSLFLMVPSLTPYDLPFSPKCGFHMPPRYANGHISAMGDPIHFMFGSRVGFQGRRIEWRYLRFKQIQDGGRRHLGKISNGHISATGRPIHFMFVYRVYRVGFLGRLI